MRGGEEEGGSVIFSPQQQLKLKQQPELTTQWEKSGISSMSSEKHGEQTPNYQPLTPPNPAEIRGKGARLSKDVFLQRVFRVFLRLSIPPFRQRIYRMLCRVFTMRRRIFRMLHRCVGAAQGGRRTT